MNQHLFFIFLFGFTGGVALRSFFSAGGGSVLGGDFVFAAFLFFLSIVLFSYYLLRRGKRVFFVSLLVFSVFLGVLRFDVSDFRRGDPFLDALVGERITAEIVIVDEPDERENNVLLTARFKTVTLGEDVISVKSKAVISAPPYPRWEYGDRIAIVGELARPKNFLTDSGREFDYVSYLAKDGIFYRMSRVEMELLAKGEGSPVKEILFSFKSALLANISAVLPEPHVSLLGGLIVGAKRSLGKDLLDDFRKTGIIHIVVLSGYNVTIVAEALMRFFSFLPRMFSLWIGAGSIVLFAIMTGAGATIVRASIMALMVVFARATGRVYEITIALLFAGFLMILFNPKILIFDISFQLSFLATLGLIYFPPLLGKFFRFVPTKFQLREFALATVATQLFVLPLLLYRMGELSLVALPVNLLILVFVPLTMLFGFLAGVAGFVATILALPFAFITYGLLFYELKVVELFAAVPFASVGIPYFPAWLMLSFYFFYGWLVYKVAKRIPKSVAGRTASKIF